MESVSVFISYSPRDEAWKNLLLAHLHLYEKQGVLEVQESGEIQGGTVWSQEIETQIKSADIAILLVSSDFLASDFIVNVELPAFFSRYENDGIAIYPILLTPSPWTEIPALTQFQFRNSGGQPLSTVSEKEINNTFTLIASEINEIARAIAFRKLTKSKSADIVTKPKTQSRNDNFGEFFISHSKSDGDFAELLKFRIEGKGHKGWIDTDRLSPGVDWRSEIDDAIRNCTALIAIMSPDGRESEYVTYEWAFAWGSEKRIIPIMLHQTSLHPRLATLQFLDFTKRESRPWLDLFDTVNSLANSDERVSSEDKWKSG